MSKPTMKQRILTVLAGVVLLAFTVWFSWMVSPIVAFFFLLGSIWFIVWGFKTNKSAPTVASIVILCIAGVVLLLTGAYFAWVGGYTF